MTAHHGTWPSVAAPAMASNPISVAVSNPIPKANPTPNMREGRSTTASNRRISHHIGPPWFARCRRGETDAATTC